MQRATQATPCIMQSNLHSCSVMSAAPDRVIVITGAIPSRVYEIMGSKGGGGLDVGLGGDELGGGGLQINKNQSLRQLKNRTGGGVALTLPHHFCLSRATSTNSVHCLWLSLYLNRFCRKPYTSAFVHRE